MCDTNIIWCQAVFEVFYNPWKFSKCEEVFGWLLANSVCYRSFLQALEFSNLGEESFDHRQDVLSGCDGLCMHGSCMVVAVVVASCFEEFCMSTKALSVFLEASFVFTAFKNAELEHMACGSRKRPLCETSKGSDDMFKSVC